MTKTRITVLVSNDLVHDQRVRKECDVFHKNGLDVTLVGRQIDTLVPLDRPYSTKRFKLPFSSGALFYAALNIRLFFFLLNHKTDAIWANDLDTLWPAYLIAKWRKIPVFYDSHEYFTEAAGLAGRAFPKKVWEWIEGRIFPHLTYVYTVNESIADVYRKKYHAKVSVVRNVPELRPVEQVLSRKELNLPENKKIVILQGAFMDKDRGVIEAVHAMKELDDNYLLLLIGAGEEWNAAVNLRIELGLESKIQMLPKQPYDTLVNYTRAADVGLSLDKGLYFNYYFSLPNKLFDYVHATTPVIATALPEVKRVMESYQLGQVVEESTPQAIASAIVAVCNRPIDYFLPGIKKAQEDFQWQKESGVILKDLKLAGLIN